jgi:hypothetical protein
MITIAVKTREISERNFNPSNRSSGGGRNWWWYRGPHRFRQRDKRLRTIGDYGRSMLILQLRAMNICGSSIR